MPKAQTKKARYLPEWANDPLKFAIDPDAALRRGAFSKPKNWSKVIITGRRARR